MVKLKGRPIMVHLFGRSSPACNMHTRHMDRKVQSGRRQCVTSQATCAALKLMTHSVQ